MYRRIISAYHPFSQPLMSRPAYARELVTAATMPVAMSMVEGAVAAVLAEKVFGVGQFAFATIMAAPMFANLTSMGWSRLSRGRDKVRFIVALQSAVLLAIASVALLRPGSAWSEPVLVGLVVLVRCLMCGVLTVRSTIWRHNYARSVRGQVTSKLAVVRSVVMSLAPLAAYSLLDYNESLFRVIYPCAAAVGVIGAASFARVRLRRGRELLTFERQVGDANHEQAPVRFWHVLRDDKFFRLYMTWQFIGGLANQIAMVAMARLIVTRTAGQPYEFATSITLLTTIPLAMMILSLSWWARYFDRVHIARYRTRYESFGVVRFTAMWVCAMAGGVWLLTIPQVLGGVFQAGGQLAWNLGHNDFTHRRLVPTYMGIHITLTGIRGLFSAYIAVYLMEGWAGAGWLGDFGGFGVNIFAMCLAMDCVALVGFFLLNRAFEQHRPHLEIDD